MLRKEVVIQFSILLCQHNKHRIKCLTRKQIEDCYTEQDYLIVYDIETITVIIYIH